MNPHDVMWDSCKRSVPDVSLVKEHDKNDYYYSRTGFPMTSTPPKGRSDTAVNDFTPNLKNALCLELNSIKSELEKLQRDQEKSKECEILREICQQLTDLRAEMAEVKKQNEILAIKLENCKSVEKSQKKSKEFEMLQLISQQLKEFTADFKPNQSNEQSIKEMIDEEVQVSCSVVEHGTQTPKTPVQRTDYAVRPSSPLLDFRPPQVVKKQNVPQSDLSMTANKILQKYLPDEPCPPTPLWRQTEYENLIFNMTNVSVAMQRPQQYDQLRQNPGKPRYDEHNPYSPNLDYRHPVNPVRREYDDPSPPRNWPRYDENWPYGIENYRQPMEPIRRMDDYDEPEPDWRPSRPKLIGLSAIMNQPKLL